MTAVDTARFDADVARALRLLGAAPETRALDALVDRRGAALALSEPSGSAPGDAVLRVAVELSAAAPGYAPPPADPMWLRLTPGSSEVSIAPLRCAEGAAAEPRRARASRVAISMSARPCCEAPSCKLERSAASVWIELDEGGAPGPRLLAAEARDLDARRAVEKARPFAAALARSLGAPLVVDGAPSDAGAIEASSKGPEPGDLPLPRLSAAQLARFALRSEGDRIVVRDLASRGPKISAARTLVIGALLLVAAATLGAFAAQRALAGGLSASLPLAAAAALVALTGYAFVGVGRFASRYAASSEPALALGVDRMIVAPWVARDGAVDLRHEGRLGAAIPVGEVRAAYVRAEPGDAVIELETDHGPFDALACGDKDTADVLCEAIRGALDDVRHPKVGASARQRARAKAHA